MKERYNRRETRGFSIYEHSIMLKYLIELNENNSYYDSFQGSDIEGNVVEFETDKDGYIVPSRIHNTPDLVCAFLGDSSVECSFVDQNRRYPYVVGRKLEKCFDRQVNSFNAAVSGADTLSLIKVLLNKVFLEHPEIVFICNTKSELLFLLSAKEDLFFGVNNNKERIIYSDQIYSADIFVRIKEAVDIVFAGRLAPFLRKKKNGNTLNKEKGKLWGGNRNKILEMYKSDLEAFVKLCVCRNIKPVLMTQANRYAETGVIKEYYCRHDMPVTEMCYEAFVALYNDCNDLVRMVAREQDILLIDLDMMIGNNTEYLYDAVHYTNVGSEKAAQIIVEALQQ